MEATVQLEALVHRGIDLALLRVTGTHAGVQLWPLQTEQLMAAVPASHPLAAAHRVDLANLAHEPFIMFPRVAATEAFDNIIAACRAGGLTPDIVYEATNDHTLIGLVAAGLGVSLVPESTSNLTLPGIAYRPLTTTATTAVMSIGLPESGTTGPALRMLELARELYPA